MAGREESGVGGRRAVYCIVPRELAVKLHEPLRRHFRDDPSIEVVVERRGDDRRARADRRSAAGDSSGRLSGRVAQERRSIRSPLGRRVGERRAAIVAVEAPRLPRKAHAHAARLIFVERIEPSALHGEDVDTARLVARIQGGDPDAFGNLYTRYFDRVYSYVRVMLRNRTDAEEVTQDIFADVFEGLDRYVPRERPFRAWLFTIARNHAINHMQRERRLELVDPQALDRRRERPIEDDLSLDVLDWISDHDVRLFIERLPLAQREVLLLRYLADMTHDEIAKALDRSPATVRMQLSRALSFLRDRLAAIGREPKRGDRIRSRVLIPQSRVLRVRRFGLTSPGPTG